MFERASFLTRIGLFILLTYPQGVLAYPTLVKGFYLLRGHLQRLPNEDQLILNFGTESSLPLIIKKGTGKKDVGQQLETKHYPSGIKLEACIEVPEAQPLSHPPSIVVFRARPLGPAEPSVIYTRGPQVSEKQDVCDTFGTKLPPQVLLDAVPDFELE